MINLLILIIFCCQAVFSMDMNAYKKVISNYSQLVPDYDFDKKKFLKDGPQAPFDKAIIYSWHEETKNYKCRSLARNGTSAYCESWFVNKQLDGDSNCTDVLPPGGYSCAQQKEWGKCGEGWMSGYCECTCATERTGYGQVLNFGYNQQLSHSSSSDRESEVCNCLENSMGPNYCSHWFCTQQEMEEAVRSFSNLHEITRQERNNNQDAAVLVRSIGIQFRDCICRYESLNGKFCQQWHCLKTEEDGATEIEEQNCDQTSSQNNDFCIQWKGRIISENEKWNSRCKCDNPQFDHCNQWTCFYKGHDRSYLINFICFIILSISFLIILFCVFAVRISRQKPFHCYQGIKSYLVFIFIGCFVGVICVLAGGLIGLFSGALWTFIAVTLVNYSIKCSDNNSNIINNNNNSINSNSSNNMIINNTSNKSTESFISWGAQICNFLAQLFIGLIIWSLDKWIIK